MKTRLYPARNLAAMEIGLVGLPNVGKSTLFNALTAAGAAAENFPFCTITPNLGVAPLPDARLARLAEIYKPEKILPAAVRFVDIAGLVRGAHEGAGLGNQFLSHIREVDAVAQVVRSFEDDDIVHVDGTIDPVRDIETIATELGLADLSTVEKRLDRSKKAVKGDPSLAAEVSFLERLLAHLSKGEPARTLAPAEVERTILREMCLLTAKPVLYVANVAEGDLPDGGALVPRIRELSQREGAEIVVISAKIESEVIELPPGERAGFLASLGLRESGVERLARAGFRLLGRSTYFTGGPKEVRAWEIRRGALAPEAAGVIHTDFERTFIRAEVVSYDDLVGAGSMEAARAAGRVRMEGKEYPVADGDVCNFRVGAV